MAKYKALKAFKSADGRVIAAGEVVEFGELQAVPHLSEENQKKILKGAPSMSIPAEPELEPVSEDTKS